MTIPKTPIKQKKSMFDVIVNHLVVYMELARASRQLLINSKKLSPPMDLRLTTEINFCEGTLTAVCRVAPEILRGMVERTRKDPQFEEEVKRLATWLVPDCERILIRPNEYKARPPLPSKSFLPGGRSC